MAIQLHVWMKLLNQTDFLWVINQDLTADNFITQLFKMFGILWANMS